MFSIYQQAMGESFNKLHPKIQERFGISAQSGRASVGIGVMDRMYHGTGWTFPFLWLGARRRIMFPESAPGTRFVVENYAYVDPLGRQTVTWVRTFDLPRARRRFDAYMIYSQKRRCIVDYLGTHQHLAVDLALSVGENGGLCIRSGEQRFFEHILGFRFPLALAGVANVCEWYDDRLQKYRIKVDVQNEHVGPLFGYEGTF